MKNKETLSHDILALIDAFDAELDAAAAEAGAEPPAAALGRAKR